jgi:hypothetical protein
MRLHHSAAHAGAERCLRPVWPDLFGCNYSRQPKNKKDAETLLPAANILPIQAIIDNSMEIYVTD